MPINLSQQHKLEMILKFGMDVDEEDTDWNEYETEKDNIMVERENKKKVKQTKKVMIGFSALLTMNVYVYPFTSQGNLC